MFTIEPLRCSHRYGQHAVRRVDDAHEVHREEVVPGRGELVEHQPGVVHEAVDVAELVDDLLRPSPPSASASLTSASITSARRPSASMSSFTGPAWSMRFRSMIATSAPSRGQRPRVRRADALRGTGHDADLALEPFPHGFPLLRLPRLDTATIHLTFCRRRATPSPEVPDPGGPTCQPDPCAWPCGPPAASARSPSAPSSGGPTSSWSACGCTAPRRRDATPASSPASTRSASPPPTTSTPSSAPGSTASCTPRRARSRTRRRCPTTCGC